MFKNIRHLTGLPIKIVESVNDTPIFAFDNQCMYMDQATHDDFIAKQNNCYEVGKRLKESLDIISNRQIRSDVA